MSLLLAGGLCLLPFLLPWHQPPILSFQAEWLAASIGIAAALAALIGAGGGVPVAIPRPARWLIAFALFLAAQSLVGKPVYPQLPLLGALYVVYAVLLIWLGAQLAKSSGPERAATVLATCLLAGALANAAAGLIQFYHRPLLLENIIAELHRGSGAYGNIAQSNLYANYLALGATALLFLWRRRSLRSVYALAAALLLAWAGALSGSRSALLYALWLGVLAMLSARMQAGNELGRVRFATYAVAGMMLAAQVAIPWLNDALQLGNSSRGAFERLAAIAGAHSEARSTAWLLALRVFAAAPLTGVGVGGFAGAAFELGLAAEMTPGGVWTSPHNLPLHLLAETGFLGAFLALAGLGTWCWQAARRYLLAQHPVLWWSIAATGIELIHSMFEYPLWNAHFLGITALMMGLGAAPGMRSGTVSRRGRTLAALLCVLLALALALLLRDYLRLDATRATGTSLTLASAADAERDAAVMHKLTRGPLAPMAELRIFLGLPLNRGELAARLAMSARVARYHPSGAVIARRVVFLALDGQAAEARRLLSHAMHAFPHQCKASVLILEHSLAADRAAIEPLLAVARSAAGPECS